MKSSPLKFCTSENIPTISKKENSINKELDIHEKINNYEQNIINQESNNDYTTPKLTNKVEDISYSKLEMPVSFQLTNGKCIRLQHSEIDSSFFDLENELEDVNEESANQKSSSKPKIILSISSSSSNNYSKNNSNSNKKAPIFIQGKKSQSAQLNKDFKNYGKRRKILPMKFIQRHSRKLGLKFNIEQNNIKNNFNNNSNDIFGQSYKKFHLLKNNIIFNKYKIISANSHFNSTNSEYSPIHIYLPYNKKDDENYKKNLLSYIKENINAKFQAPKSVNHLPNQTEQKFIQTTENLENFYFFVKKKKKIYSTKKIFAIEKNLYCYELIDGENYVDYSHPKKFRFYFDNDIGFDFSWQKPLIETNADDDVESDDEIIELAEKKCQEDLFEGIKNWTKNQRLCRNYCLNQKFMK